MRLLELDANEERSKLITMNLLEKSGLRGNRPERDANMIQDSIYEAAHQLRNDSLKDALDRHFDLNYLGSVVNLRISVSKPLFPSFPRKREPRIR